MSTQASALRVAATTSPSEEKKRVADMKPREQIAYLLTQKKGEIEKMLPKHLNADRLLKVAQIAATTTPDLLKCDVASLVGAIGQCAQMGLEPNTVLGHAYLVPFNTKRPGADGNERWVKSVQVIVGYKGLIDLARRSGQIVSIAAHEVCKNDSFDLVYGLEERLVHKPEMNGDRGDLVGFYAVAKLKDGGHAFEFMSLHQVQKIMEATQSKGKSGPWKEHFTEMGRKTVIRRLAKYLPLSVEFQTAVHLDELQAADKDQHNDALDGEFLSMSSASEDGVEGAPPALTDDTAQQSESRIPQDIPQQQAAPAVAEAKPRQARAAAPEVPDDFDIE